jgi:hypothetical protein
VIAKQIEDAVVNNNNNNSHLQIKTNNLGLVAGMFKKKRYSDGGP